MGQWISKEMLAWVSIASGVGLLVLAIVIPWLIVKLISPENPRSNAGLCAAIAFETV